MPNKRQESIDTKAALQNKDVMNDLVAKVHQYALSVAKLYRMPYDDANDFAQDMSLKIFLHLRTGKYVERENSSFNAWVGTCVKNGFINYWRKKDTQLVSIDDSVAHERFVSTNHDSFETKDYVDNVCAQLKPKYLSIVRLRAEGYQFDDMERILGIKSSTLRPVAGRIRTFAAKIANNPRF